MFLKNLIGYAWKVKIRYWLQNFRPNPFFDKSRLESRNRIFVFLAADYSNLGDVAITHAHNLFLQKNFPDNQIFEIPISQTIEGLHFVRKNLGSADLITTVGGGNFGNLYADIEFLREWVVAAFPKNKVVLFPLTNDFSADAEGRKALAVAQAVYGAHGDLTITAREAITLERNKMAFPKANCILTPDIVMSLDETQPEMMRKGVVLALRADKEKQLSSLEDEILQKCIRAHFDQVRTYDTHLGTGNLSPVERKNELSKIWNAFKSSELVVTDRLHGMIFCYITNTPCMVLMNNNHKIRTSYEWIRHSPGIRLVTEFSAAVIDQTFTDLKQGKLSPEYRNLSALYQPLIHALK